MPESIDSSVPSTNQPPEPPAHSEKPPAKRRRRRWPFVIVAFLLLIALLVVLAPTIASTSVARRYVIGKINQDLNGTVDIADWSIGWTGGVDLRGVKVFDDRNAEVISVARVHTGLSLIDALRGRYHFGDTLVEEPNLEQLIIYKDGTNNLQKLFKQTEKKSGSPSGEKKAGGVPDVSGNLLVSRMRAMVINQRDNQQFVLQPDSKVDVKVKSLNDPIENDVALYYKIGAIGSGEGAAGSVKLAGTAKLGDGGTDPTGSSVSEKIVLDYDLEKLLVALGPTLPPSVQENLKDFKVAGKATREFVVRGTYPVNKPFNEAVRSLTAYGSLAVDRIETQGVTISKAEIPVSLVGGVASTTIYGKPEKDNLPPPADFNGGKINFGGLAVDLRGSEPRVSTPDNFKFLTAVSINPLVGDKFGKYLNPMFPNSKRAQGLLDVTFARLDRVALGAGLKTADSGNADIDATLREMEIANPLGSLIIGGLLKQVPTQAISLLSGGKGLDFASLSKEADTFRGQITRGHIRLVGGRTTQDVQMELVDPAASSAKAMVMAFNGDIQLSDLRQNLSVTFPTELLAKFIPIKGASKTLADIFPQGIPLTLKGTTSKIEPDYGDIGQKIARGFAGSQLNALTGGNKGDKKDNPIGGLIDSISGDKKGKFPINIPGLDPKPEAPKEPAPEPAPTRRRRTRGATQPSDATTAPAQPGDSK